MAEATPREIALRGGGRCRIRTARPPDAEALIDYINAIGGESPYLATGPNDFHYSEEDEADYIRRANEAENSLLLVAEIDGRIAGSLTLEGGQKPRTRHAAELGITVSRPYWGQGVGRALMETALAWAESSPILRKINLVVRHDNKRAIELYRRLGFVQEGRISDFLYIDGVYHDCLYMGRAV
jgi:RimJ/RimL family protein N-acetyltransferase